MSDSVIGSTSPAQIVGEPVTNGGFVITNCCPTRITGDGKDEFTLWSFDFRDETNLIRFTEVTELSSALLRLTLTPGSSLIDSDSVRIEGLSDVRPPVLRTLPLGVTTNIEVELLDFYASSNILSVVRANAGVVPMFYQEDALVSYAELLLVRPEIRARIRYGQIGSLVQICWNSESSKTYEVQYRLSLSTNDGWQALTTGIQGNGSTNCFTTTGANQSRFYRVVRFP